MVTPAGGLPYQPIHHNKQSNPEIIKEIEQLEQLLEDDKNLLSPQKFNQLQTEIEALLNKLPLQEPGEFSVQMNAQIQAYHDDAISGGKLYNDLEKIEEEVKSKLGG